MLFYSVHRITCQHALSSLAGYPLGEIISVCDLYEMYDNSLNYYHYQPGSNNIIVYGKHITHFMYARTRTHSHIPAGAQAHPRTAVTIQVVAVTWAVCAEP